MKFNECCNIKCKCARCGKEFTSFDGTEKYCSDECEFELPIAKIKYSKPKKPRLTVCDVTALTEEYYRKTGKVISYGKLVNILEKKK